MPNAGRIYATGDWVVHLYYGVGEIKGIETKVLSGKEVKYYRVKTKNSTFWVPLDQADCDRLRPIATTAELKQALRILQKPPREMDTDHNLRKQQIRKIRSDGSLPSVARLVRDLWARQNLKKLNTTEERALSRFQERLVAEWSVCMDIKVEEARNRLQSMLNKSLAHEMETTSS